MSGPELTLAISAEPDGPARWNHGVPRTAATILVADNDAIHRDWVADTLAGQGYSIVIAASGEEAFARVEAGGIDLLVSAIALPGMDGLELLRALRDSTADLPVIAIASGMSNIDWLCLKGASLLGAAAAYTRPLPTSVFLDSVRQLLAPGVR